MATLEWTTVLAGETAPAIGQRLLDVSAEASYDMVCGSLRTLPYGLSMLHAASRTGRVIDVCVVYDALGDSGTERRIQGNSVAGRSVLVIADPDAPTISASLAEAGATIAVVLNLVRGAQ